jgi:hypothetical protein
MIRQRPTHQCATRAMNWRCADVAGTDNRNARTTVAIAMTICRAAAPKWSLAEDVSPTTAMLT